MKIDKVKILNFRVYKGKTEIDFSSKSNRNINIVAGKNGFGKTTFLTSLIWCFYGNLMIHVEDKYRKDIRNIGGYNNYLNSTINKEALIENPGTEFSVEVILEDIFIPSIACRSVSIKRTYCLKDESETLQILIDGDENELTKSVGYDVFINDFILPREIAKFFFFDAEKIVSLAEAKSKKELKSLSKAYSEVLGIKKYEDLKKNLESLLTKLRREGVNKIQESELNKLLFEEDRLEEIKTQNENNIKEIDKQLSALKIENDSLQEKLIREGNSLTLEKLKELKIKQDDLKLKSDKIKAEFKKNLDLVPLVLSGKNLKKLYSQLCIENNIRNNNVDSNTLQEELKNFADAILQNKELESFDLFTKDKLNLIISDTIQDRIKSQTNKSNGKIYLESSDEFFREFEAMYSNLKNSFLEQIKRIIKDEKNNRALLNNVSKKIKQGEARKNNHLAKQIRDEKNIVESKIHRLQNDKDAHLEKLGAIKLKLNSHKKIRSEYEKNFKILEVDKKKYLVTEKILIKINDLISKIKKEKKHSLQKSILIGLKKLMHKNNFIKDVRVNIIDDVMDIDLLNNDSEIIDKESLSKGEQQLYATALLKALVDESGIKFPIFIDSPLQKFDKYHSQNILKEFYPYVSEQVVLFPLLEKELSEKEFRLIEPNISKTFLIQNIQGNSTVINVANNNLFEQFNNQTNVFTN